MNQDEYMEALKGYNKMMENQLLRNILSWSRDEGFEYCFGDIYDNNVDSDNPDLLNPNARVLVRERVSEAVELLKENWSSYADLVLSGFDSDLDPEELVEKCSDEELQAMGFYQASNGSWLLPR